MTTSANTPIIRLAHPLAFAAFLRHIGAPVERHLRAQGLPALCENPNALVPLHKAWSFFDAAAQYEDPMAGWHVGRFVGDHGLNAGLLRKLESAPTLYLALQGIVRMVSAEASHLQIGIHERSDDVLFYTHYASADMKELPGYATSQAYQLEAYLALIRHFVGQHWVPDEIGIEYPTVPAVAEDHFPGSRIRAKARLGYLTVPRSCLHMAAPSVDPEDHKNNGDLVLTAGFSFADTLAAVLKPYLAEGYPTAADAASLMDTSPRTVARRLSASGRTYGEVVDEVRFNAAKEMLQNPDARIIDVSESVGFRDPSHFTRMFRRIGGLSPSQFRQSTRG